MSDLQEFDLENYFHDDTFVNMLEYRERLENHHEEMSQEEQKELYYLDEIVISYANLYANRNLQSYEKLAFKVLEKIATIAKAYVSTHEDIAA